ncbi:hypothetical protein MTO96_010080 [Rhipicephalus appendiculatus]
MKRSPPGRLGGNCGRRRGAAAKESVLLARLAFARVPEIEVSSVKPPPTTTAESDKRGPTEGATGRRREEGVMAARLCIRNDNGPALLLR